MLDIIAACRRSLQGPVSDGIVGWHASSYPQRRQTTICEIHGLTTLQPTRDGCGLTNCRDCKDYLPELRPDDPDPQVRR